MPGGRWKREAAAIDARLTDQTFTCAARAHVATAARRTACMHVSRAMQAARRRSDFDFTSRLGRRTEAGPRQVLRRVSPLAICEGGWRLLERGTKVPHPREHLRLSGQASIFLSEALFAFTNAIIINKEPATEKWNLARLR